MADVPDHIKNLLVELSKIEKSKVEQLTALLAANPNRLIGGLIQLLALKPVPRFTKPTVYTQPVGDVTFALDANMTWAQNYRLLVFKNEAPVSPPANVLKNGVNVPSTAIEIPSAGSGDLVIPAAYFTQSGYGSGNYLLKIVAQNLMSTAGYGVAIFEIELT